MYKRISGTRDILPDEIYRWQKIEEMSRRVLSHYNYKEIRPPLMEQASLFNRSLGESSDIVKKQMFLIKAKEDDYALRPEGTASIVRAYIENNLDKTRRFIKLYYIGAMFRYERPQKGRLRQFHHIGIEAIGSQDSALDVEVISLADDLLRNFAINGYKIKVNSLGCAQDKKALSENLNTRLKGHLGKLCDDCKVRFKKNILRVLDCKNEACINVVKNLNIGDSYLCRDCKEHFAMVLEGLDSLKIGYEITPLLVRGLDYYTRTVFEITHKDLGAQDALGAGGRYDNLVKELGGPELGAIGFAFGMERILLATKPPSHQATSKNLVYLITLGEEARQKGIELLDTLRKNEIPSDTDYEGKSLKGALRLVNDLGARFAVIIGEDELNKNIVTLKDMVSGEQREIVQENLIKAVSE